MHSHRKIQPSDLITKSVPELLDQVRECTLPNPPPLCVFEGECVNGKELGPRGPAHRLSQSCSEGCNSMASISPLLFACVPLRSGSNVHINVLKVLSLKGRAMQQHS